MLANQFTKNRISTKQESASFRVIGGSQSGVIIPGISASAFGGWQWGKVVHKKIHGEQEIAAAAISHSPCLSLLNDALHRSTVITYKRPITHRATSRHASSNHLAHRPSTMNATSTRSRAWSEKSRTLASTRHSSFACSRCHPGSTLYSRSPFRRPSARDVVGDSRCLPYGRRPWLLHSSTRARYLSGAPLFHPYSQSRAASLDPLMRIRDLPWPRLPSLPSGGLVLVTTRGGDRVAVDREPNKCN